MNFGKKGVKPIDRVIIVGIAISIVLGMTFILQPASLQEKPSSIGTNGSEQMSAEPTSTITPDEKKVVPVVHTPPDPFTIAVNGHTTPAIVATVKRGQTSQVDVFISPNISGITGNVEVSSVFPMCGTVDIHQKCTPAGTTTTLSANVTSPTHLILALNVSNNMPVGTYLFHVQASTVLNVPFQATPVHVGDSAPFAIKVV
ncbi:MAG: hypothetical protein ACYDAJ_11885 [Nitrosotalea sp.]